MLKNLDEAKDKIKNKTLGILVGALLIECAFVVCPGNQSPLYALQASYYSKASLIAEGTWKNGERRMANGERFTNGLTCATRLYSLGTVLRITNLKEQRSVVVKVTDRIGKRFAKTRIDLSELAFSRISKLEAGVIPISVEVMPIYVDDGGPR
jgi:rare lipoprotein A (peptidoglycan hydrolase)